MKQHQHKQELQPAFEFVGLVVAGIVLFLLIFWLIDIAELEPGASVEDVLGPHFLWIIILATLPLAVFFALLGEAVGTAFQNLFRKVRK